MNIQRWQNIKQATQGWKPYGTGYLHWCCSINGIALELISFYACIHSEQERYTERWSAEYSTSRARLKRIAGMQPRPLPSLVFDKLWTTSMRRCWISIETLPNIACRTAINHCWSRMLHSQYSTVVLDSGCFELSENESVSLYSRPSLQNGKLAPRVKAYRHSAMDEGERLHTYGAGNLLARRSAWLWR